MSSFKEADLLRAAASASVPTPRDTWLFDAMPQPVIVSVSNGAVAYCNRAWLAYTGQAREHALGEGWAAMASPEDRATAIARWHEAVQAGVEFQMEYRLYRVSDAGYRLHLVHAAPVRDEAGNLLYWLGIHTEVHDRKLIEERFRATFEQAAVGIALVGMNGEWLQVNRKLCDILGYSLDELLLTTYNEVRHPDDVEAGRRSVRPLLSGEIGTYTVERRYLRRDGSILWANLTISLVRNDVGTPQHYICVIEDIVQRKQQEAEIAVLNRNLQERIVEFELLLDERGRYEADLQAVNRRLERAMQETHHRVKNNLQLIAAFLEMAIEDYPEGVPQSEARRLLQQLLLLSGVHDILTNASKAVEGHTDTLSAQVVLGRMLALLKATAQKVRFEYRLAAITLSIHQVTSLTLIANELVNNAIKHGSDTVQVTLTRTGDEATLMVEDDGPGFSADFGAETAARTGLTLVENLTRHDLRGTASFENRDGGGGRALIAFPLPSV